MYRIAVIGDKDSVYGYAALGLRVVPLEITDDAASELKKLCNGEYAVIYITEALATELSSEIDKYREQQIPAIIPIPGITGNNGMGISGVKRSVEKAVGSDIIFND